MRTYEIAILTIVGVELSQSKYYNFIVALWLVMNPNLRLIEIYSQRTVC